MRNILDKIGKKQLLFIYYGSASHAGCKGFRKFMYDLSAQTSLRNVVFVEVDLDLQALREVGMQRKIQVLPTVEAWRGGTCLDTAKGGEPAKVMEMLDRHFDEIKDSGGGITTVQVAEAVFVAGVVWALWSLVQRRRGKSTSKGGQQDTRGGRQDKQRRGFLSWLLSS